MDRLAIRQHLAMEEELPDEASNSIDCLMHFS